MKKESTANAARVHCDSAHKGVWSFAVAIHSINEKRHKLREKAAKATKAVTPVALPLP